MNAFLRTACAGLTLATALATSAAPGRTRGGDDPARAPASDANRFAGALFGRLAEATEGNFVVSPFSIHSCMAMVAAGAAGDTESQMNATLGLAADRTARNAGLRGLRGRMDALGAKGDVTLEVANRVWVQKSYPLLPAFTANVGSTFGAGFAAADFVARADGERKAINGWVEDRTRSRIKDLIPPGLLGPDTRMVLVNAVYFYGTWQTPFPAGRTESAPFHVAPGRGTRVDLMQARLEHLGYHEEPGLQVCELPYKGRELSMVVLLPAAGQLGTLEARLAREGLDAVAGGLRHRTVNVGLPRFKIEASFGLKDPLIALGMRDAFAAERADFSGMTGTRDLFVSAVVHKAFIEVNEKGTEAAAATGAVMAITAMPIADEPVVFRADRPFLFALRDRASGIVLFLGRVSQPGL